MNKKSQTQMMETIAVLFIFFILIAFGFIFYANVLKGSVEITKREHSELKAVELAEIVSSLPELHCSEENIVESACVDKLKIDGASSVIQSPSNRVLYFDMLGYSDISIEEVYPGNYTRSIYSNIPGDYKNRLPSYIPLSVKDPINKGYSFGVMTVVLYTR